LGVADSVSDQELFALAAWVFAGVPIVVAFWGVAVYIAYIVPDFLGAAWARWFHIAVASFEEAGFCIASDSAVAVANDSRVAVAVFPAVTSVIFTGGNIAGEIASAVSDFVIFAFSAAVDLASSVIVVAFFNVASNVASVVEEEVNGTRAFRVTAVSPIVSADRVVAFEVIALVIKSCYAFVAVSILARINDLIVSSQGHDVFSNASQETDKHEFIGGMHIKLKVISEGSSDFIHMVLRGRDLQIVNVRPVFPFKLHNIVIIGKRESINLRLSLS
jgi:hypothetical protein